MSTATSDNHSVNRPSALEPETGLGVLHLFFRVGNGVDTKAVLQAVQSALDDGYQVVPVSILGHKADIALMVLGPDLWRLRIFQSEVSCAGFELVSSYVSLTEVSEYAAGVPNEMKQARMYPVLPPEGLKAFSFYPMSKRRNNPDNWYLLDYEERNSLMLAHGKLGRTFHGRIVQLITGSTGLDDWEWGVTLFGARPDDLKECVYQMRFDEASARYADFGPFYLGMVGTLEEVLSAAGLDTKRDSKAETSSTSSTSSARGR